MPEQPTLETARHNTLPRAGGGSQHSPGVCWREWDTAQRVQWLRSFDSELGGPGKCTRVQHGLQGTELGLRAAQVMVKGQTLWSGTRDTRLLRLWVAAQH